MKGTFLILLLTFGAGSAHARVEVKSLRDARPIYELPRKNLYAIGQAESSNATITILNGRIYNARYEDAKPGSKQKPSLQVDDSFKTRAAQLTYSNVKSWNEVALSGQERTSANLGPFMNKVLKDTGYELAGVFPFLLKGRFSKISISSPSLAAEIPEKQIDGIVLGFLTKTFRPNPEKPGSELPDFKMQMHFVDDAGKRIGIVGDFDLDAKNNVTLFMPR